MSEKQKKKYEVRVPYLTWVTAHVNTNNSEEAIEEVLNEISPYTAAGGNSVCVYGTDEITASIEVCDEVYYDEKIDIQTEEIDLRTEEE